LILTIHEADLLIALEDRDLTPELPRATVVVVRNATYRRGPR